MGNVLKAAGKGRRTRQYNPTGAKSFEQYLRFILIMRGQIDGDNMTRAEAHAAVLATPAAKRSEYAKQMWRARKRRYGRSGRGDANEVPF